MRNRSPSEICAHPHGDYIESCLTKVKCWATGCSTQLVYAAPMSRIVKLECMFICPIFVLNQLLGLATKIRTLATHSLFRNFYVSLPSPGQDWISSIRDPLRKLSGRVAQGHLGQFEAFRLQSQFKLFPKLQKSFSRRVSWVAGALVPVHRPSSVLLHCFRAWSIFLYLSFSFSLSI